MKVEIKGIDFSNKGALLMLESILQEFSRREIKCEFVVEVSKDYSLRKNYPLHVIFPRFHRRLKGVPIGTIMKILPKSFRKSLGFVVPKEIDIVIDSSGFAYSEQWGRKKAERRLGNFKKRYGPDTKLILLPQAFGPFGSTDFISTMQSIFENCDLIYARDKQSLTTVEAVCNVPDIFPSPKIVQRPDFTQVLKSNNAKSILPDDYVGGIYLVVNHKVIEKGGVEENVYIHWFCEAIEEIQSQGSKAFFLNHEGEKDRLLTEKINTVLDIPIPLFESFDPLELKKAIGCSIGGVASRFHAVASSLSQSIPVCVIGWSHKYIELASEYGASELVISDTNRVNGIEAVKHLYGFIENREKMSALVSKKEKIQKDVAKMWDEIFDVLNVK